MATPPQQHLLKMTKTKMHNLTLIRSILFTLFFILSLFLVACGGEDSPKMGIGGNSPPSPSTGTSPKMIDGNSVTALVFCDLTSNMDLSSMEKIAETAADIIVRIPTGSKVKFIPIGDGPNQSSLLDFEKESPNRTSDKPRIKKATQKAAEDIKILLMEAYENKNQNYPEEYARSCIWSLVESKIGFLRSTKTGKTGTRCQYIVILSDMIEQCNDSPIGKFSLTKKGHTSKQKQTVEEYTNQDSSLFREINIVCVSIPRSGPKSQKKFLPDVEVNRFWKKLFTKQGANRVDMESELPPNFCKDCLPTTTP